MRQAAWDFVVIDECLAVQNAAAKRCPSAWRQIEVSMCGALLLSATFFRSSFHNLFYMIRMLRSPLPRTLEYLPSLIHEHIVCEVPDTNRTWEMVGVATPLGAAGVAEYRKKINAWERDGLNRGDPNGLKLHGDLKVLLMGELWEGRNAQKRYGTTSPLAEAVTKATKSLVDAGRRPVVFAKTMDERNHLRDVLRHHGVVAIEWSKVNPTTRKGERPSGRSFDAIVATTEGEAQGVNMQHDADAIVCRPIPGDKLEQMKGRVDRPGQTTTELQLHVVFAGATVEEAEYSNIFLAGTFFRQYLAPKASRYNEQVACDLQALRAVHGKGAKPKLPGKEWRTTPGEKNEKTQGAVEKAWRASLAQMSGSGVIAGGGAAEAEDEVGAVEDDDGSDAEPSASARGAKRQAVAAGAKGKGKGKKKAVDDDADGDGDGDGASGEVKTLNNTLVNKASKEVTDQAKATAREGKASIAVRRWLFGETKEEALPKPEKDKFWEFSDTLPPKVMDRKTVEEAVEHLSKDPKLKKLITRVGLDAIFMQCHAYSADKTGEKPPTKIRLFSSLLKQFTFVQITVDAGNAFLRKLTLKIGSIVEAMPEKQRDKLLKQIAKELAESGEYAEGMSATPKQLYDGKGGGLLLEASCHKKIIFTPAAVGAVVDACDEWGLPHLTACDGDIGGRSFADIGCGKNDDPADYLEACREHLREPTAPLVSVRYSLGQINKKGPRAGKRSAKGAQIIDLVRRYRADEMPDLSECSDREAAKRLSEILGVGPWVAGEVLMHFLGRADIMLSGDLTVRNYLNDLYGIAHNEASETQVESAADFGDTAQNRIKLHHVAVANGWAPYRSIVGYLMYFLQEDNLVLL